MSAGDRIKLRSALVVANRFMEYIDDACYRNEIAGSCRRRCEYVGDIEIVCVPRDFFSLKAKFPEGYDGMTINGPRLKRFKYPKYGLQIELYITTQLDWGRIFAIRTGSSGFSHSQLSMQWNRLGWCGTVDGLRRKKECDKKGSTWKIKKEYKDNPTLPPAFSTERKFFEFLQIDWVDPVNRNWTSPRPELNYSP